MKNNPASTAHTATRRAVARAENALPFTVSPVELTLAQPTVLTRARYPGGSVGGLFAAAARWSMPVDDLTRAGREELPHAALQHVLDVFEDAGLRAGRGGAAA